MNEKRCLLSAMSLSFLPMAMGQSIPKIGIENETSWYSKYIWRGMVVESKSNFQSDNTIYLGNISLNVANRGRSLRPTVQMGSDEVDFTLGWNTSFSGIDLQPILTYYTYSRGLEDENTLEPGLCLSKGFGEMTLFSNHSVDAHVAKGAYYGEAGIAYEKDVGPSLTAGATITLGWGNAKFNAFNFGVNKRATNAVTGEFDLTYRWGPAFYVRPWVGLNRLVDKGLRNSVSSPDNAVWGIAFGFSR